jgi:hypothetical protein
VAIAAGVAGTAPGPGDRVIVPVRRHVDGLAVRVAAAVARGGGLAIELADLTTVDIGPYALWSGASLLCTRLRGHRRRLRRSLAPLIGGVPVLMVGPNCDPAWAGCRRFVVAVEDTPDDDHVVEVVARIGRRIGAELELIEVLAPGETGREVPESAHLVGVARRVVPPPTSFDTLHDRHAADAILRFVNHDATTVIALACGRERRLLLPRKVVRGSPGPVLLVPVPAATQ